MRVFIFSLVWLLCSFCLSAQEPEGTQWHQFRSIKPVTDAAETSTDIWFSTQDHLVRIDKATGSISLGRASSGSVFNASFEQIWVDADDRPHLLIGNSRIASLTEEGWVTENVPTSSGLYDVEAIINCNNDGTFLLQGESIDLFRWKAGSNTVRATDLEQAAPWRIDNALYDPLYNRYWVSRDTALGYITDGVFIPISLPPAAGNVIELQLDRNQQVWARTEHLLLKYRVGQWAKYYLPEDTASEDVRFTTLGGGAAFVATPKRKILLRPAEDWFAIYDYSEALKTLRIDRPLLFDENGTLWWIDETKIAVASWRAGDDITYRFTNFWLPLSGNISQLTSDRTGRIWLTGNFASYYYADRRWWPASALYPNFPDSVKQIAFSKQGTPVVIRSSDPNFFNADASVLLYDQQQWSLLPDGDLATSSALPNSIALLRIDRNDHLLIQRGIVSTFQIWAYRQWHTYEALDFFPLPSRIYDIAVGDDQLVYLLSSLGLILRSGQNYRIITPENLGTSGNSAHRGQLRFSPEGTLWSTHQDRLVRWQADYGEVLPRFENPGSNDGNNSSFTALYPFADDDIWLITTDGGFYHYDGVAPRWYHPNNSGMPFAYPSSLAKDDRDRIWFSDGKSVAILTPPAISAPTTSDHQLLLTEEPYLFPNPACCQTQIRWQQSTAGKTSLQLYNARGQLLHTILNTELDVGTHTATVQRNDLPAGVYYLILDQDGERQTQKILWK